jgi:DNA repair exonuclease SbcCD nuclease subunit
VKILFTGDWHLDRSTAGFDRFFDVVEGIEKTLVHFRKSCDSSNMLYVFLGDLANPNNVRSHRAVATAIVAARNISTSIIGYPETPAASASIWLTGNHDVIEDGSGESTLTPLVATGYCTVIDKPAVVSLGKNLSVVALPYPASCNSYDPAEFVESVEVPAANKVVAIGHLSMAGIIAGSESGELARGREYAWPVDAIKKRWPAAIMVGGHYHRSQVCNGVIFPGSLERLGFDEESNVPGFVTLEISDD